MPTSYTESKLFCEPVNDFTEGSGRDNVKLLSANKPSLVTQKPFVLCLTKSIF